MSENTYVQYGCGLSAPSGWRNFDASPTLWLQRIPLVGALARRSSVVFPANVEYGDITARLPLPDGVCQGVYCSHILEHLSLADLRRALRETFRILKSGGMYRLVVPDLEYLARSYVNNEAPNAAVDFMKSTLLGMEQRGRSPAAFAREWLGNARHLWMWDYKSLSAELYDVDFHDMRRAKYGDSIDPKFSEVEDADRWNLCLGIECRRP